MNAKFTQSTRRSLTEKGNTMTQPTASGDYPQHNLTAKEGSMKAIARMVFLNALIAFVLSITPNVVSAQDYNSRGCAWPLELSPEGSGNVQGPDGAARYWVMPFDTQYEQ